jgi:hypothetical protein
MHLHDLKIIRLPDVPVLQMPDVPGVVLLYPDGTAQEMVDVRLACL